MPTRRKTLACLLALPAVLSHRQAAAAIVWRIATEYPATAIPGEGIMAFARSALALSGGALTVQPGFDAPDGLRSADMIRAVAEGRTEAADAFTGALGAEAALFQLSALPFLTASATDTARLLAAARPAYEAALSARGATLLYATPWPATGIWSRLPLPGPAALQGLRVRTYDAASTAVLRAAGADPVAISFADAMPRLRDRSLDAVLSSGDGGAGARLWEILPNFTVLNYASPLSLAFCSTAALRALSPPLQQAVADAAKAAEARQFSAILTRLSDNETRMRDNGVTIAAAPLLRDALAAVAAPIITDWTGRAGPEGAAILETYRAR